MPTAQLDDRALVRVAGPEAATFLQNLVTQDVDSLALGRSAYAALLTPQGKILCDFLVHRTEDGYLIDVRAGQEEALAKRLALYRLRAKVEIALAPEMAVYDRWPAEQGEHAPDPRLAELGHRWIELPGSLSLDATTADWHAHRIGLAVPEGGLDFVFGDAFPHDAAMDSLHGVSFEKGCYVGQEVVSRMRHRGTARRRIVALSATEALPEPGTELVAGDRAVGRLGSSAGPKGIGLVRLDRVREAMEKALPIRAGSSQDLAVALPAWATYDWPGAESAGEA